MRCISNSLHKVGGQIILSHKSFSVNVEEDKIRTNKQFTHARVL
ncbi:unnamed protein product [Schistosoma mattheei]|uniref:Uncharacterized protein n=1 Tax=Schistosoma mattheei TaxID=31246 RepID=A0A183NFH3_9TREM|nr:unnamed protein product [Schistosoma mattheei]